MAQVEEIDLSVPDSRRMRFEWLLPVFIRPARTMRSIAAEEHPQWLLPMLILTVLTILFVLVAGPLRQQSILGANVELPPGFEYMTPEQQEQYFQAQQSGAGTAQTHIFPGVAALSGLWLSWFVLGGVLHLVMTLLGSRSSTITAYNLTSWASMPFALRLIVQMIAMLITKTLISSPGLSGFIAADAAGALSFARVLLGLVDIYLIWQFVLLVIGSAATGLPRGKAFAGVLLVIVLVLVLGALPGFGLAQLSGLSVDRPFIFF
jgi:hypothetical protein